jgi:hypothetical protein
MKDRVMGPEPVEVVLHDRHGQRAFMAATAGANRHRRPHILTRQFGAQRHQRRAEARHERWRRVDRGNAIGRILVGDDDPAIPELKVKLAAPFEKDAIVCPERKEDSWLE